MYLLMMVYKKPVEKEEEHKTSASFTTPPCRSFCVNFVVI